MRTKLSAYCDKVMEAGWLLALIIVPLFFDVYSSRVFEPDKLGLLRSIAALMAVAWLVKWAEERLGGGASERNEGTRRKLDRFVRFPLVLPTALTIIVYLLTTAMSVVPRMSWRGSYVRLQGAHTTLSYIVIFFIMLQGLRRQEQLRRLWTTVILTSLPIALFGLVQHWHLDPLPWGADATVRITSHMGNAIFIGGYLIMVIPLTLARIVQMQTTALGDASSRAKIGFGIFFWLAFVAQIFVWATVGFGQGLAMGLLIIAALVVIAAVRGRPMSRFLLLGSYGMVLSAQLTCLVFSQSRGPLLGVVAGLFFFGLLYLFSRHWHTASITLVGVAIAIGLFLGLLNLPKSPLAAIRDVPYVGRMGRLTESETGTGKVRVLIWEGAVEMIQADPLRAAIGYGPEAMYLAYNPFYPPDLAHYEARNASPDRSHNETFDAVIMRGLLGLIAYIWLFMSVFYYGLCWLGLIHGDRQRKAFYLCTVAGGLLGVLVPLVLDGGLRFAGVGMPVGLVAGLLLYASVSTLFGTTAHPVSAEEPRVAGWSLLLLAGLIAAVLAHFIEINFSLAMAVSRTYFWAYAAMIVVLGKGLISAEAVTQPVEAGHGDRAIPAGQSRASRRRKEKRRARGREGTRQARQPMAQVEPLTIQVTAMAILVGLIGVTLAWDYTTNPLGLGSPFSVIINSLTTMAAKKRPDQVSLGMAWLVLVTFVVSVLTAVSEVVEAQEKEQTAVWWLVSLGRFVAVAGGIAGILALTHAHYLIPLSAGKDSAKHIANVIYEYYAFLLLCWAALATVLHFGMPRPREFVRGAFAAVYALLLVACLLFIDGANIRIIKADVYYKQGLKYDGARMWDQAIHFYGKAIDTVPDEDFYYLFSGRAIMERAKVEKEPVRRDVYYQEAAQALLRGWELNPMNTDFPRNLGRLYRVWADASPDNASKRERLSKALDYYEDAARLSPHNAEIYNEWGVTYYTLGEKDLALSKYEESLALDQEFAQTRVLLGDLHRSQGEFDAAVASYQEALALGPEATQLYLLIGDTYLSQKVWPEALDAFEQAVALDDGLVYGWSRIAYCYGQLGNLDKSIEANLKILRSAPNDYVTLKNLMILYEQEGQVDKALSYLEQALVVAPKKDKGALEAFQKQLQAQQIKGGTK